MQILPSISEKYFTVTPFAYLIAFNNKYEALEHNRTSELNNFWGSCKRKYSKRKMDDIEQFFML